MSADLLGALFLFAFVSSITPGPNNLMLMASGANFRFRRTLPHLFGVALGFMLMIIVIGLGLMGIVESSPYAMTILKVLSTIYMLWLAWRIFNAAAPEGAGSGHGRPIRFVEAMAFQWVNPKAWAMALTSIAVYAPSQSVGGVLWVTLIFGLVNLPCVSAWTLLGQELRQFLQRPGYLRAFNGAMALLLILSLYPVLRL